MQTNTASTSTETGNDSVGKSTAWAMAAISVAVCMATLDTSVTNTALPTIAAEFHASESAAIWTITSYQLTMIAAMLPLSALGERAGYRRVFIGGLVLFTIASAICGASWSLVSLIFARALQGLGGAAIMSANTALVRIIYPEKKLGRGLGFNVLVMAFGLAAGPTIASIVTSFASWKWLFLINIPLGFLAITLSAAKLPSHQRATRAAFDYPSALLCAAMFALLIYGLGESAHLGAWQRVVAELAVAAVCGYAMIRRQRGRPAPIFPTDLFSNVRFRLSLAATVCAFATQGVGLIAMPFLLQSIFGRNILEVGFFITPWPLLGAIMGPIAGPLSDRIPATLLSALGMAVLACGMAALAVLPADVASSFIVISMMICGLGFGLFLSPNQRTLMSSAPPGRSGSASGMLGISRLFGQAAGAAFVALCLALQASTGARIAMWGGILLAASGSAFSAMSLYLSRKKN